MPTDTPQDLDPVDVSIINSQHFPSIMPRHKDLCQFLEHANFFLPTSPVFTKHKIISSKWAESTGYACNTTLVICSNL